jgi:hypothetical protein
LYLDSKICSGTSSNGRTTIFNGNKGILINVIFL